MNEFPESYLLIKIFKLPMGWLILSSDEFPKAM